MNLDEAMRDYEALPRMMRRKIIDRIVGSFGGWPWINRPQDWDIKFLRRLAVYGTPESQKEAAMCMEEARELKKRGASG